MFGWLQKLFNGETNAVAQLPEDEKNGRVTMAADEPIY
jgi:hypothetical protein